MVLRHGVLFEQHMSPIARVMLAAPPILVHVFRRPFELPNCHERHSDQQR